jgi:ATP phosphoribosyltransferase
VSTVRVALPSKGSLSEPMFAFLKECGLSIDRPSSRSYTARFRNLDDIEVSFLRAPEIVERIRAGELELGLTGRDLHEEAEAESPRRDALVIVEDLGFGRVDLLLAIPEGWLDVEDLDDLRALCRERGEEGRPLRIATKFTRLTEQFLKAKDVGPVRFVPSHGSTEAAPRRGDADLICDLSETGTTLAENGLRPLAGGSILRSAACLIASAAAFREQSERLALVRPLVQAIEARLLARNYLRAEVVVPRKVTAKLIDEVSAHVGHDRERGLAVAPIFGGKGDDLPERDLVTFLVERKDVERARRRLATLGIDHMVELSDVGRLYAKDSAAMARLEAVVKRR